MHLKRREPAIEKMDIPMREAAVFMRKHPGDNSDVRQRCKHKPAKTAFMIAGAKTHKVPIQHPCKELHTIPELIE